MDQVMKPLLRAACKDPKKSTMQAACQVLDQMLAACAAFVHVRTKHAMKQGMRRAAVWVYSKGDGSPWRCTVSQCLQIIACWYTFSLILQVKDVVELARLTLQALLTMVSGR